MTYPGTLCSYMLLYDKAYEEFVSLNQAKDDVYLRFRAAAWRALQVVYELKGFPAPSGFDLSGVDTLPGRPIINTRDIPRFLDKCRNKVGNYYKESCAILRCWKHDLERTVMLLCDMELEVLLPYDELNKVLGEIIENNLNFFQTAGKYLSKRKSSERMLRYATYVNDVSLWHSTVREDGSVKVEITKHDSLYTCSAVGHLPDFEWDEVSGFSNTTLSLFKVLIKTKSEHIMHNASIGYEENAYIE